MQTRTGRLIDHVHLIAHDVAKSKAFYKATFAALGIPLGGERDDVLWCDEFYLSGPAPYTHGRTHVHLAFQASDRDAVRRWYRAGLDAGGRDNGAPGERHYHAGYYAAFLLDPDGNNVEAVFHGTQERPADTVTVDVQGSARKGEADA